MTPVLGFGFRFSVRVLFAAWTGLHHHIRELLVHNIQRLRSHVLLAVYRHV